MNKTRIRLLFALSAFIVLVVMVLHYFWVQNAVKIRNDQFGNEVQLALKNVVNELIDPSIDTCMNYLRKCNTLNQYKWMDVNQLISSRQLDRILNMQINNISPDIAYEYGIHRQGTDTLLMVSNREYSELIMDSGFRVALTCLHRTDGFELAVYFPGQKSYVFSQILGWVIVLWLLIFGMIAAFYAIIASFVSEKKFSAMKADFVNNMTHELKTPIASIALASDMLLKKEVNTESCQVQRYAKIISEENIRLRMRVDQVMHIAKVEKGEFSLQKQTVDVNKLVQSSLKPYKLLVKHQKGKLVFRENGMKVLSNADPLHLENAVSNLVDNAIKYSVGPPEIFVEVSRNIQGVFISVEDHGIGISEEHQKNIFKRFYRVSTGDLHDVKGFGLGLYYVKSVVDAHGGSIALKSTLGKGSRFELFIPVDEQDQPVDC